MDISETIQSLLESDKSFALCKLPSQDSSYLVLPKKSAAFAEISIDEAECKSGFLMSPFDNEKRSPIFLEGDIVDFQLVDNEAFVGGSAPAFAPVAESYRRQFDTYMEAIKSGRFEKLVLSRSEECFVSEINVNQLFAELAAHFPKAFIYIARISPETIWVGATPEVFLKKNGNTWETVALAGTLPHDENRTLADWNHKNIKEQHIVSQYITEKILSLGGQPLCNGPHIVQAGNVDHLGTVITFESSDVSLAEMMLSLHPTPAVCGTPKAEAQDFIRNNEESERDFYSGVVGLIFPDKATNLYVNLRCAKIEQSKATFFAGGGLVAESEVENEWNEIQLKMNTLRQFLC